MRRRMQGFIREGKPKNTHTNRPEDANNNENKSSEATEKPVSKSQRQDDSEICMSRDELITDIIAGLAKSNTLSGLARLPKSRDSETSEELINKVIQQYQQQESKQNVQQQSNNQQQQEEQQKLQEMLKQLLLGAKGSSSGQQAKQESTNPIIEANDSSLRQSSQQGFQASADNQQSTNQAFANEQSGGQFANQQTGGPGLADMTGKTARKVLSEAQMELSNELEVSLNKLRTVIDESKQIAQRISMILEQNNDSSNGDSNE